MKCESKITNCDFLKITFLQNGSAHLQNVLILLYRNTWLHLQTLRIVFASTSTNTYNKMIQR